MANAYVRWQGGVGGSGKPPKHDYVIHGCSLEVIKVIMLNSWKTRRTKYLLGCSGSKNDNFFSKNCRLLRFSREEWFSELHSKSKVCNSYSNYQTTKFFALLVLSGFWISINLTWLKTFCVFSTTKWSSRLKNVHPNILCNQSYETFCKISNTENNTMAIFSLKNLTRCRYKTNVIPKILKYFLKVIPG